jgi:hypothetical protein
MKEARHMMDSCATDIFIAMLLVIRLDFRFTPNDQKLYRCYLDLLSADQKNNFFIVYTHTEGLEREVKDEIKLSSLRELTASARHRFVSNSMPREEILQMISRILNELQNEQAKISQTWKFFAWMRKLPAVSLRYIRAVVVRYRNYILTVFGISAAFSVVYFISTLNPRGHERNVPLQSSVKPLFPRAAGSVEPSVPGIETPVKPSVSGVDSERLLKEETFLSRFLRHFVDGLWV